LLVELYMSVFSSIYRNNLWITGSGTGSLTWNNRPFITYLDDFIKENNITSILEIGCGDFRLWSEIQYDGEYTGTDVVSEVIQKNQTMYANSKRKFIEHDVLMEPIGGQYDLILVKDLQIHLSNEDRNRLLYNLQKTERKYLLCVEDWHYYFRDYDITTGFYRPVDLGSEALVSSYCERTYLIWVLLCLGGFLKYRSKIALALFILSVPQKRIYLFR